MKFKAFAFVLLSVVFCLLCESKLWAQKHTIRLLSGKNIVSERVQIMDSVFQVQFINEKGKARWLDFEELYALEGDSVSRVFYKPNGDDMKLSVEEMDCFLQGIHMGREKFNAKPYFWGGLGAGAGTVFLMPALGLSTAWAPVGAAALGAGASRIPMKGITMEEHQLAENPHFIEGYSYAAKRKRNTKMFMGVGAGLAVAILTTISIK